ncbi:MAG: Xaa-Pro peptidase family protein [Syntrophomonadaceae bacterium]|jgi:Xaa-Pro aminopeptidase|nr:Xaa-Pro peptidase family protein [Syntrophomonadaceae bacterium]MDH7497726.1 Xaa-Pro peptidase family protein [Syntrophomonadaceae bacterium]
MQRTPRAELERRTEILQRGLVEAGIDAALIVQNADLFYYAGTVQQGYLYVPADGQPAFFVRKNPQRAAAESELPRVVAVKGPKDIPALLPQLGLPRPGRLGMELDVLPVRQYFRYQEVFAPAVIVDVWPIIQAQRAVKSPYELALIREVGRLSDFMVRVARATLREGVSEIELAAAVEAAARAAGHQGYVRMRAFNQEVYWGHLVSGPEAGVGSFMDSPTGGQGLSLAFPQGSSRRVIARHEPVIFDLVAGMNGYHVDQTRTMALGPLAPPLEHAYRVAVEIQGQVAGMLRPGVLAGEVYQRALDTAAERGLAEHFMGYGEDRAAFCGHGIGLELDELPVIVRGNTMPLQAGMVVAMEPKFTFPGLGVVGVEDTFIVTEEGGEAVTTSDYEVEVEPA